MCTKFKGNPSPNKNKLRQYNQFEVIRQRMRLEISKSTQNKQDLVCTYISAILSENLEVDVITMKLQISVL